MLRWMPQAARGPRACVFCDHGALAERHRVLYEDELVTAIDDMNPRAQKHMLVISKAHIRSVDDLSSEHIQLLSHMIGTGRDILVKEGFTRPEQYRLGFHKPPFTSVPHLHLHCLGLPFVPVWNRLRFSPNILGSYVDADAMMELLQSHKGKETVDN